MGESRQPVTESGIDGQVQQAVEALMGRSGQRDALGRFTHGVVKTGADSRGLIDDLADAKADVIRSVRTQLAADTDDAPPILLNMVDAYAECHLLRKSAFAQLLRRGGPVTSKGKVRGLLQVWATFFDREMRLADKLGLERKQRAVEQSTVDWLTNDMPDADGSNDMHDYADNGSLDDENASNETEEEQQP